jgi:hypothetical protein
MSKNKAIRVIWLVIVVIGVFAMLFFTIMPALTG